MSLSKVLVLIVLSFQASYIAKRTIFLFGAASPVTYHLLQAPPFLILLFGCLSRPQIRKGPGSSTSYALLILVLVGSIWTICTSLTSVNWTATIEAFGSILLVGTPLLGYMLGTHLGSRIPRSLAMTYAGVIIVSVTYGVIQFTFGFTGLERTWAEATASYSLQGKKVNDFLSGLTNDLRAFSYYADPMTWNTSLVGSLVIVLVARAQRTITSALTKISIIACALGLLVSMSRNGWLIVIVMSAMYFGLSRRWLLTPLRLSVVLLLTFFGAVSVSKYVVDNLTNSGVQQIHSGDIVFDRYATLGTAYDRSITYSLLEEAVLKYPAVGIGFNAKMLNGRAISEVEWLASHNLAVDLVVYWGAVTAMVYVFFLFAWVRQSSFVLSTPISKTNLCQTKLITAYFIGAVAGAQVSGFSSIPFEFYLLAGYLTGQYRRAIAAKNLQLRTSFAIHHHAQSAF